MSSAYLPNYSVQAQVSTKLALINCNSSLQAVKKESDACPPRIISISAQTEWVLGDTNGVVSGRNAFCGVGLEGQRCIAETLGQLDQPSSPVTRNRSVLARCQD